MNHEDNYSDELFQYLAELRDGLDPSPSNLNNDEAVLVNDLINFSKSKTLKPDSVFIKKLESKLLAERVDKQQSRSSLFELLTIWRYFMISRKRLLYLLGLGLILIMFVFIATPSLAKVALEYFAPQQVEQLPFSNETTTISTIPEDWYTNEIEKLETQAGFAVFKPSYLPEDCYFREGFYLEAPIAETHLLYDSSNDLPCFEIVQRHTHGDGIAQPFVGPDSVEEIMINDLPAIYIHGTWLIEDFPESEDGVIRISPNEQQNLFEDSKWVEGHQQVVFEQNGFLIRIDGPTFIVGKEKLIKVAESLKQE